MITNELSRRTLDTDNNIKCLQGTIRRDQPQMEIIPRSQNKILK